MSIFYDTFFYNRRPHGVYTGMFTTMDACRGSEIYLNNAQRGDYGPWIKKMRPEDRLIITLTSWSLPSHPWIGMVPGWRDMDRPPAKKVKFK